MQKLKIPIRFSLCFFLLFFLCQCQPPMNQHKTKNSKQIEPLNVFGEPLKSCCQDPVTGFYRDGFCKTGTNDYGTHIVCAIVTDAFLEYSKLQGNDLITPIPNRHFNGLKAGDKWCLCISRWLETIKAGVAPKIDLQATHQYALKYMTIEELMPYGIE